MVCRGTGYHFSIIIMGQGTMTTTWMECQIKDILWEILFSSKEYTAAHSCLLEFFGSIA